MNSKFIIFGRKARDFSHASSQIPSQVPSQVPSRSVLGRATLALLLSAAPAAFDAARAQERGNWLDEITVVGTRTEVSVQDNPASVSVIDQETLQRQAPQSVAEALRDVPGVEVIDSSAAGMQRIRIRGESSRRVTILVDGQEITDHSTYGTPILVDPSNVERIDVVRGPASVLYGAKAIGGVINIITKRGANKPIQTELGGAYYSGTAGWQGWGAVSGTVNNFDYRLSGSLSDHGDRRVPNGQYTSTGRLDGSSYENDSLSAHLGYTFGEKGNHYVALKAEQFRLKTDSWTDPSILNNELRDFQIKLPKRDLRKIGAYYDGRDLSPVVKKLHLDAYYQTVERLFSNKVVTFGAPFLTAVTSPSDDRNINYGGTAQVDLQFHPDHYTIAGVNYLADNLRTAKMMNIDVTRPMPAPLPPVPIANVTTSSFDDASINTTSAFVQDQWSFAEHFKLIAGLRYYHTETVLDRTTNPLRAGTSGTDDRVVTSAGLTYTGIPNTTLRAMYSEGYITPTLLQMFTDTAAGRGVTTYGNPDLDPETSRNIEFGVRYNAGGLVLDTAAFYTKAKNYITSVPCTAAHACPGPGFIHVNADGALTYGLEMTAQYTLPQTSLTPYVTGAWMRRRLDFDTWSTYDSDTPELAGRFGARWEGQMYGAPVWADLFMRASNGVKLASMDSGRMVVSELSSWATLNFAFGGSFGKDGALRLSVHFNNILNKEYRSTFDELPGVGRSVELVARMTF